MPADQDDLKAYFSRVAPPETLESAAAAGGALEALDLSTPVPQHLEGPAASAVQKVTTGELLTEPEQFALEAIIIPDKRPAVRIVGGDYTVTHQLWMHFNNADIKQRVQKILPSVGRIDLPHHPQIPYAGTGFVVGDGLLMTNRHVAEIMASGLGLREIVYRPALGAGIDFKRETPDEAACLLELRDVVMIHPYWDMALLKVDGLGPEHAPVTLSLTDPDDLGERDVAVIGYPAMDPRNDAAVQNEVFGGVYNVKRLLPGKLGARSDMDSFGKTVRALVHDSSTLGGNSGSIVLDVETGQAVALHFAGLYLKANYAVPAAELGRDGRVIDAGLNFGGSPVRASGPWDTWWRSADPEETAIPSSPPSPPPPPTVVAAGAAGPAEAVLRIPLEISIRLGAPASVLAAAGVAAATEAMVEPIHDSETAPREGYDPGFLGSDVPLPTDIDADLAAPLKAGAGHVLDYHHFSLVMHKRRRLALFTASNLDDSANKRRPDPSKQYTRASLTGLGANDVEKWFEDPRVDVAYQLPDKFFTKDKGAFDKGHLVRREDVCWGDSFSEIQRANGDTYHTTNCSPQVAGFNQSIKGTDNWGDLENYVMKQAKAARVSIFSGPILADDDPTFVGVDEAGQVRLQVPRRFWKVVVAPGAHDPEAYGFILEQDLGKTPLEFVVDATWRRYLVPIAELQTRLGFRFPDIVLKGDQAATPAGASLMAMAGVERAPDT